MISGALAKMEGFKILRYAQCAHWASICHWYVGFTFSNSLFPKAKKEKHILKSNFQNQIEGLEPSICIVQ